MTEDRRVPAATKGVVLAGIAFFAFELYTFTDAASTHLFPSKISTGFPAPYDMYSAGMVVMLLMIVFSENLRDFCLKPAAMASGATLMAIAPLYAVLDSLFPAYFLALLGGVGKAVVFIQIGRMLGLVGPLRLLTIVTGSIVLAQGLCLFTAMNGMVFAISGCVCALGCAACTIASTRLFMGCRNHRSSDMDALDVEVPGLGMLSMERRADLGFFPMGAGEFVGLAFTVGVFAAMSIVCVNPLESLLSESGSLFYGAAGAARFATAAGAAAVVVVMLQFPGGLLLAGRLTAFALIVGAAGMLIADGPQTLGYLASLMAQSMFMMLFWITMPLVTCRSAQFQSGRLSEFDVSALMYCFGISITSALSRVGFEPMGLVFPYAAVLVVTVLFLTPDKSRSSAALSYQLQRDGWNDTVLSIAKENGLSERETEVFELLARGYGSYAIQEKLSISQSTVSTHTQRIYRKTGLHSRQDVISEVEARGDGAR